MKTLAPLLLLLTACGPFAPEVQESHRYLKALQPLVVENGHLSEGVLGIAAQIYNGSDDLEQQAQQWNAQIVPLAEHLHQQSGNIEVPESWADDHKALEGIWGKRASAYRELGESLALADRERWTEARKQATEVKFAEEDWFKNANKRLATHNLNVAPTP